MMEEAFKALLANALPVFDLVPSTSINWGQHPQGVPLPGIVLTVIDDLEQVTHQGPDGLSQARVQVDCYADTYSQAKTLGRAVRLALNGYRGNGFQGVFLAATREGREGGTNEADRPFRVSQDFQTHWSAT